MIYERGAARDFDRKFFAPYQALLRRLVLWPCLGNHDVETEDGFDVRIDRTVRDGTSVILQDAFFSSFAPSSRGARPRSAPTRRRPSSRRRGR